VSDDPRSQVLSPPCEQARLLQYYEPLRHPSQPGLSLASCQLIHTAITAGTSRVAYGPLCLHAVANTAAGLMELIRSNRSTNFGLPTKPGRVGSCISLFEACSAFTHVTACTLAKSPSDSLHQRLQQSRCLHCCSDCYRVERTSSRAGYSRCGPPPFHGAPGNATYQSWSSRAHILTPPSLRPNFIPTESGSRALLPTISAMEGQHAD
jgi:hypothetical protein